jgi:hypothetical protein
MGETEKELQRNPDGNRVELESLDARRAYAAPEVRVLEFRTIIKAGSGRGQDSSNMPQTKP